MTGKGLAEYAKSKLGTPYFYGMKMETLTLDKMKMMHSLYPGTVTTAYMNTATNKGMIGKVCCDCSGLIGAYRKKQLGSSQLYSSAKKRLPISKIDDFAIGTVLWKSGHVGVYIGKINGVPYCIEAKGINYGCIKSKVSATRWLYGLTFSDMTYEYDTKICGLDKKANPFAEPTGNLKKGSKGNGVKWLQFELNEAGYGLDIDGDFGTLTHNAVKSFQKSSKLLVDGIVGKQTVKALKAN